MEQTRKACKIWYESDKRQDIDAHTKFCDLEHRILIHEVNTMLINLTKEELCLISIALNAYQMETDNYHLDEMKEISTRIDNTYKMCTCKENVSEWTLLLLSDWPTTPMKSISGMIVTLNQQRVTQICDSKQTGT